MEGGSQLHRRPDQYVCEKPQQGVFRVHTNWQKEELNKWKRIQAATKSFSKLPFKRYQIYALTGPNYIWRKFTVCVDVLALQNHNENPFGSVFALHPIFLTMVLYAIIEHHIHLPKGTAYKQHQVAEGNAGKIVENVMEKCRWGKVQPKRRKFSFNSCRN